MFFEPLEALLKASLNPGVGLLFMYRVHSPWKVSTVYTLLGKLAQCLLSLESEHSVHFPWKVSTVYTPWKVGTVYTLPGELAQYTLSLPWLFVLFLTFFTW